MLQNLENCRAARIHVIPVSHGVIPITSWQFEFASIFTKLPARVDSVTRVDNLQTPVAASATHLREAEWHSWLPDEVLPHWHSSKSGNAGRLTPSSSLSFTCKLGVMNCNEFRNTLSKMIEFWKSIRDVVRFGQVLDLSELFRFVSVRKQRLRVTPTKARGHTKDLDSGLPHLRCCHKTLEKQVNLRPNFHNNRPNSKWNTFLLQLERSVGELISSQPFYGTSESLLFFASSLVKVVNLWRHAR